MEGVKFILLGDGNVGKTCLMLSFAGKSIRANHIKTIGIDMEKRIFNYEGNDIEVKIWDTAGQERYRAITSAYYRGAVGALLVYDVCKYSSFENVEKWLKELRDHADSQTVVLMTGNKADLKHLRAVNTEEAALFAQKNNLGFLETSALEGINVEKAFEIVLNEIYQLTIRNVIGKKNLTPVGPGRKLEHGEKSYLGKDTRDNSCC